MVRGPKKLRANQQDIAVFFSLGTFTPHVCLWNPRLVNICNFRRAIPCKSKLKNYLQSTTIRYPQNISHELNFRRLFQGTITLVYHDPYVRRLTFDQSGWLTTQMRAKQPHRLHTDEPLLYKRTTHIWTTRLKKRNHTDYTAISLERGQLPQWATTRFLHQGVRRRSRG